MSAARWLRNLALAALLAAGTAFADDKPAPIGMSLKIHAEGFFSTTVVKATVESLVPDSQALKAGLAVGDELLRVQGITVPGNKADVLKPHMKFEPGVPKKLAFKRADGSEYEVTLIRAAAKSGS